MNWQMACTVLLLGAAGIFAQAPATSPNPDHQPTSTVRPKFDAFEVATIKPVNFDAKSGRYITMQGTSRFVEKAYTLKLLIAAAYDMNPRTILGGPGWIESDHYDIVAVTPCEVRPTHEEQMSMLRNLLTERFSLTFHREQKEFSIYMLEVAKGGPKLKQSTSAPGDPPALISTVFSQHIHLPARNASMGEFVSLLQRAVLDRPVVDKTGVSGKYDFDLDWAPDETQFGGDVPVASAEAPAAPLFSAIQEQLGLKLTATRGPVDALVVDKAEQPSAN
ncbi:MAG: TIGR03435 family protein [Terracidiphilus sp.]